MCILKLSKIPMYEFLYDYIKNKYGIKLRLLSTETDSKMHEIETENVCNDLIRIKKCLILVIILLSQNITMIQSH